MGMLTSVLAIIFIAISLKTVTDKMKGIRLSWQFQPAVKKEDLYIIPKAVRANVPTLKLHDGHDIPALALGTWLGNNTKPAADEVVHAVSWAIDAGYTHIDTALVYKVEDQVGRAIAAKIAQGVKREDLFITTKLWNDAHAQSAVVPALRQSLANLGLQYVDLYLIHWPVGQFLNGTYDYTDYVDTWRGMIEAKNLGLTRSIGVSNFNQQQIDRLLELGLEKPTVLQVEINLNLQQPELLAYCARQDIRVMGYTPFGSLFYNKALKTAPPPRVDDPALVEIANKYRKTVPQVALRYLVELGVIPLPKSLTKSRIEQNVQVFDFSLTQAERDVLKSFDRNYRTIPQYKWLDHPYYPFEKKN
ncbi:aldo-keto reductase AKR2E4-like isoform X1 [Spodoptera litura]|uniref:Aldo-keto reductase AKR2E4-like isoform X1 n=1 Tax=Spodoptera litura TaxID=69820 RepID=A0A9J7DUX1_SPOLT|nr:aldo-keto reductase AKR2E4-like isoform X1 [Spodoptera litura]